MGSSLALEVEDPHPASTAATIATIGSSFRCTGMASRPARGPPVTAGFVTSGEPRGLGCNPMANPRAEAEDKLGGDYEARVLEPSPPAVTEPPYADDPVHPGEVPEGRELVSPVHNRGDLTWDEIVQQDPDLGPWCAERWLAAWKRLEPLPDGFAETRRALHEVAQAVVAPARKPENEISLRYTRGGFGTPFFDQDGADCQVRVIGTELIRQRGNAEESEPLPAEISAAGSRALGDLFGFA